MCRSCLGVAKCETEQSQSQKNICSHILVALLNHAVHYIISLLDLDFFILDTILGNFTVHCICMLCYVVCVLNTGTCTREKTYTTFIVTFLLFINAVMKQTSLCFKL